MEPSDVEDLSAEETLKFLNDLGDDLVGHGPAVKQSTERAQIRSFEDLHMDELEQTRETCEFTIACIDHLRELRQT